jgi:dolichol-phosphate mannosyltransferase
MLFFIDLVLGLLQLLCRIFFPELVPRGVTSVLLAILFFGAFNLFALGILGEYIGKIFEEVKQRPLYLRRGIIRNGEVRTATTDSVEGPR